MIKETIRIEMFNLNTFTRPSLEILLYVLDNNGVTQLPDGKSVEEFRKDVVRALEVRPCD